MRGRALPWAAVVLAVLCGAGVVALVGDRAGEGPSTAETIAERIADYPCGTEIRTLPAERYAAYPIDLSTAEEVLQVRCLGYPEETLILVFESNAEADASVHRARQRVCSLGNTYFLAWFSGSREVCQQLGGAMRRPIN